MRLMTTVTGLVKPGGWMVFNNCVFQIDLYSSLNENVRRELMAGADLDEQARAAQS